MEGEVLQNLPESATQTVSKSVTTHYQNASGEILTPEQYSEIYNRLHGQYDGDIDEWDSLEGEFEFKKFNATWKAVTEVVTEEKTVPISVIDLNYNENDLPPFTKPCRLADANPSTANYTLFRYSINRLDLFKEVALNYGLTYAGSNVNSDPTTFTLGRTSAEDLGFLQIAGRYTEYKKLLGIKNNFSGTLEECKKVHDDNLKLINDFLKFELAITNGKKVDKDTIAYIHTKLKDIYQNLSKIEVKSKSYNDLYEVKQAINGLISNLGANV